MPQFSLKASQFRVKLHNLTDKPQVATRPRISAGIIVRSSSPRRLIALSQGQENHELRCQPTRHAACYYPYSAHARAPCSEQLLAGDDEGRGAGGLEVTIAAAEDVGGAVGLLSALHLVEGACGCWVGAQALGVSSSCRSLALPPCLYVSLGPPDPPPHEGKYLDSH